MMSKRTILMSLLLFLVALVAAGCGLLREPEAPSAELEASPVEVDVSEDGSGEAAAGGLTVYTIDPTASQVRFELNELLRGEPVTVVGTTDQIAGEIAVDLNDLTTAAVGEMQINARGLATDNNFRNRAIQNEILQTGDYEFISFVPTAVEGMPASAAVGEPVTFTVTGDLTIRDITRPVTFEVTATAGSATQLSGTAGAVIQRADYNLNIPTVRDVADVEEEVELYIDFVATAG